MRRRYAAAAGIPALLLCFSFMSITISAQDLSEPFRPLKTDTPPVIDGVLDDAVWQQAPWETGFKTFTPDYGIDMEEDTIVYYAYDRENLYFAYKCLDSRPDLIKSSVTARDRIRSDDWICINLDTYNDHQSLFAFYTNPLGIQMDSRATAVMEDGSADFVWYSAGQITDEGYTIEVQIPFKSIRFSYREPVIMGVIFERYISRLSQGGTYPALDPRHGPNFLTQTRPLIYEDIEHYRLVEILPGVTYSAGNERSATDGTLESIDDESAASLTLKYGLTSRLTVDGTWNPDFSQVESDAGQVEFNQRYARFYSEKRPFFLEGREFFNFGAQGEGHFLGSIVHTRTIIDPRYGLKLTGNVGEGKSIATIVTRDEYSTKLDTSDAAYNPDPADSYIFRYKHGLDQDSFVGGVFTMRDQGEAFNRVFGLDGRIRLDPSNVVSFHGFGSQDEVPALATEISGRALGLDYTYFTRDLMLNFLLQDLSEDFNTETGYLTRTGVTRYQAGMLKMFYPESEFILRADVLVHSVHTRDHPSGMWERYHALDGRLMFGRSSMISAGYVMRNEIFLGDRFDRNQLRVRGNTQFTKRLFLNFNFMVGKKIRYQVDPYQGFGADLSGGVVYQFTDHLSSSLSTTYSDFYRDGSSDSEFDVMIARSRNTWQINKYLFLRAILEYYSLRDFTLDATEKELTTDLLASFTYIPGTVVHIGYGSLYNNMRWDSGTMSYMETDRFLEMRRGFFFKASYLWRF
ncbi:DUF5916 domain-containing protein [Gemmatimonadota bacterium]